MMTVNAENRYAAAMTALKAGNHSGAMSNLLEFLEVERNREARLGALIAAAELDITCFQRLSGPNKHLAEANAILTAQPHLPAAYRGACDTLEGQRLMRIGEYGPAADTFRTAVFAYRAEGNESGAINGEMLLAACLLATGDAPGALAICRQVRRNPLRGSAATENHEEIPSRLLELNALQAKVAAALGNQDDALWFAGRVLDDVRSIIGDAQFRALAEVVTVAGAEFVGKRVSDLAYTGARPFPRSLSVIG